MGEGYVHQGHFFRMSSHDVTNVLPWPRPGCVGREELLRLLTRGGRCRTPGIKFNQHHNLHAIAQRFHRGGDSSTRDTKSPFKLPR